MKLGDLEIYKLAREIGRDAWNIFSRLNWETKKAIGFQWIEAVDSVGANIAEGFGRFHFLDKNKFNYNARGSLYEVFHWTDVLCERKIITNTEHTSLISKLDSLKAKLNGFILSTKNQTIKK
jgi:four helix bundle protein